MATDDPYAAPPPPKEESGAIDMQYIKGIPGLLKLLEGGFSLIAFVIVTATWVICSGGGASIGYFKFVSMAAFVVAIVMWLMGLLKLQRRIFRCDCINWPFLELMLYGAVLIFYFFGDLFLALNACVAGFQAGAAFGFFAFFAFIVDFVFVLRVFIQSRKAGHDSPPTPGPGATSYPTTENKY